MRPPCAVSPLPPPSAGIVPSPIPPIPSPPLTHSVDATVTSSINPYLGRVTLGLRKHSWFSDLVDLSDPRFTFSASRGASLDLHQTSTVGSDPKRATAVRTAAGELARARCAVILSAGVWGTASMLMSSLGSTTLSGLWEHAVQSFDRHLLLYSADVEVVKAALGSFERRAVALEEFLEEDVGAVPVELFG